MTDWFSRHRSRSSSHDEIDKNANSSSLVDSGEVLAADYKPMCGGDSDSDIIQTKRNRRNRWNKNNTSINQFDDNDTTSTEVYLVRQQYGYCSILFSFTQTVILALMMWQCGVAPLTLNPMLGPYPDALSEWGGKNALLILEDGESYRLVTPIFLHAGVFHLLGNVAVQLETGIFFEREWGSMRWLLIYLTSAIGSSVLSVICMPMAVSVGSSGAVMGLFGGKLAEVTLRACERQRTKQDRVAHEVRKEQCCIVTTSVTIVLLFSFIPFVDWAAHLGGLLAGIVIGVFVFAWDVQGWIWKILWMIVGLALTITSYTMAFTYMYSGEVETTEELRDVCGYYKENFEEYECNCMREEYLNNGGDN